jgi:hypothetical protein
MRPGLYAAALTLALAALCATPAAPAGDLGKEFLSKPWGSPLADFQGLVNVGVNGKIGFYIHPKQAYTVFDAQVSDLVYGFYDDKFFAAYVGLDAIDAYSTIKRQIQQRFGVPKISMESRGDLTTHSWKTGETRIKMKYSEVSGAMKLSFYYMPLANRANLDLKKELDEEPPEPLFPLSKTREKDAVELLDLFNY